MLIGVVIIHSLVHFPAKGLQEALDTFEVLNRFFFTADHSRIAARSADLANLPRGWRIGLRTGLGPIERPFPVGGTKASLNASFQP